MLEYSRHTDLNITQSHSPDLLGKERGYYLEVGQTHVIIPRINGSLPSPSSKKTDSSKQ